LGKLAGWQSVEATFAKVIYDVTCKGNADQYGDWQRALLCHRFGCGGAQCVMPRFGGGGPQCVVRYRTSYCANVSQARELSKFM
jgi:hypothetical protein